MILQMMRDVEAMMIARKFPVSFEYGPDRTQRDGFGSAIVFGRDRTGISDVLQPPTGSSANPHKRHNRWLACQAMIYAQSMRAGAMVGEHEDECEKIVDGLLVAITDWLVIGKAAAAAQAPTLIKTARYVTADELKLLKYAEAWPGVIFVVKFAVPRGVSAIDYNGAGAPTGAAAGVSTTVKVTTARQSKDVPPETLTIGS